MEVITVGVEDGSTSEDALRWAVTLAESLREAPRLQAVHVLRETPGAGFGLPPHAPRAFDEERRAAAEPALDDLVAAVTRGSRITVEQLIVAGDPADALLHLAEDADMLVLGATARSHISNIILGSTSQKCIAAGVVPVTVVPPS